MLERAGVSYGPGKENVFLFVEGGKAPCLALYYALKGKGDPRFLLTMMVGEGKLVSQAYFLGRLRKKFFGYGPGV